MNGDTVNSKIQQGGLLDKWLAEKVEPLQVVERLYISCLGRKPTEPELTNLKPLFTAGSNVKQALEDTFWALLNSREFLFNH